MGHLVPAKVVTDLVTGTNLRPLPGEDGNNGGTDEDARSDAASTCCCICLFFVLLIVLALSGGVFYYLLVVLPATSPTSEDGAEEDDTARDLMHNARPSAAHKHLYRPTSLKQVKPQQQRAAEAEPRFARGVLEAAFLGAGLTPPYATALARQVADTNRTEDDDELAAPQNAHDLLTMRRLGLDFAAGEAERVGRLRRFLEAVAAKDTGHAKHFPHPPRGPSAAQTIQGGGGGPHARSSGEVLTFDEVEFRLEAAGFSGAAADFLAGKLYRWENPSCFPYSKRKCALFADLWLQSASGNMQDCHARGVVIGRFARLILSDAVVSSWQPPVMRTNS